MGRIWWIGSVRKGQYGFEKRGKGVKIGKREGKAEKQRVISRRKDEGGRGRSKREIESRKNRGRKREKPTERG